MWEEPPNSLLHSSWFRLDCFVTLRWNLGSSTMQDNPSYSLPHKSWASKETSILVDQRWQIILVNIKTEVDIPVSLLGRRKACLGACTSLNMVEVLPLLDIFTSLGRKMLWYHLLAYDHLKEHSKKWWAHSQMHSHTQKRKKKMRNKRLSALKSHKTHIQPSRGRKECLDGFRKTLGVLIYRLKKRKIEKISLWKFSATILSSAYHGAHVVRILEGATV